MVDRKEDARVPGVLDAALISGLELEEAEGVNNQELELLHLALAKQPAG